MSYVSQALAQVSGDFNQAEEISFAGLEDGTYPMTVLEAYVEPNKNDQTVIQLTTKLITDEGRKHVAWLRILPLSDNPESKNKQLGFLKGQLKGLGFEGDLAALEYATNAMIGQRVEVQLKTKPGGKSEKTGREYGPRQETYFAKVLERAGTAGPVAALPTPAQVLASHAAPVNAAPAVPAPVAAPVHVTPPVVQQVAAPTVPTPAPIINAAAGPPAVVVNPDDSIGFTPVDASGDPQTW